MIVIVMVKDKTNLLQMLKLFKGNEKMCVMMDHVNFFFFFCYEIGNDSKLLHCFNSKLNNFIFTLKCISITSMLTIIEMKRMVMFINIKNGFDISLSLL